MSVGTVTLDLPWPGGRGPAAAAAGPRAVGDARPDLPAGLREGARGVADEAGDAFSRWAAVRGPALVRLARGLLRDPHQAEDVVQDVLAKVLVQWARVSAADDMDAYVNRMVVNACTSFFRRAWRRHEFTHGPDTLPERPSADPTADVDEADRLVGLLRRLPDRQRTVLVLRHYENLPDARIAAMLGTTEVTVRTNAHRGLAALRRMVESEQEQAGRAAGGTGGRS